MASRRRHLLTGLLAIVTIALLSLVGRLILYPLWEEYRATPSDPEKGYACVWRGGAGKGEVIALGQSLWWNWIRRSPDNARLLRNFLEVPPPTPPLIRDRPLHFDIRHSFVSDSVTSSSAGEPAEKLRCPSA